jgi:hypothetical protein
VGVGVMGRRKVYNPHTEEMQESDEADVPRFTEDVQYDAETTLKTRVYVCKSSKESSAVVQEMKRRFSDEFDVPYSQLKGMTLDRDGYHVRVLVVPKTWENENNE